MFEHQTSLSARTQGSLFPPQVTPTLAVVTFSSAAVCDRLVAGVPAVARMARACSEAGQTEIKIALCDGGRPSAYTWSELGRLAAGVTVRVVGADDAARQELLPGVGPESVFARDAVGKTLPPSLAGMNDAEARAVLDRWGHAILRATAKPTDGIVSRLLNRPLSQALSKQVLRLRGVKPLHATWATGLIALAMLVALLLGGQAGLLLGAVLFQAASITDGVDGEIARATHRESAAGARLDSLIDAATNLAFIAGVALNLYLQGDRTSAYAGGIGLIAFAAGLAIIGRRSRRQDAGLTFNAIKDHFGARPSPVMTFLTWLTMRDFFALAFAVLIASGFAGFALKAFLVIVCGWLLVVVRVMLRRT